MRLWSLHPSMLDTKGLGGLWREGLGARKILIENLSGGYANHSQLHRFKNSKDQVQTIEFYLHIVWEEATLRGFNYNINLIGSKPEAIHKIEVTYGQVVFELEHLKAKLQKRDKDKLATIIGPPRIHPLFKSVDGPIASWER